MEQFKSYITEVKDEPYKIVCFYHTGESNRDVEKTGNVEWRRI